MKPGDVDLSDPVAFADGPPHGYFRMLRAEAPVCWHRETKGGPGFFAVTRYEDVKRISRDPTTFSSYEGCTNIDDLPAEELGGRRAIMLNMDPPQHATYRRLVQRSFTPRMVRNMAPQVRAQARRIVDAVAPKGSCEFVAEIAAELPMQVICEMMGVPEEDRRAIYDLSNRLIGFDDPEFQASRDDGRAAGVEMFMYAAKFADHVRAHPGPNLGTALLTGDVDGEHLDDLAFNSFFLLLAAAGNETTRTVTSHGMRLLIEHPEQRERLLADPAGIPAAIEEIVRHNPPVMYFRRTATCDTELHNVSIKKGQKVVMWYPSANRDEEVFPDADRFDVGRQPNDHLAFGSGEHFCLGASLARLELEIIFDELLRRLPDMRLAGPYRRLRSNFIDGMKEMPVAYTPR